MVRHIILWNYQDELTKEQRAEAGLRIKQELEALVGVIPGLLALEVAINPLPTGNADLMLDSSFVDVDALMSYQIHPEHVKVSSFVKSVTCNRMCMDMQK